MFASELTQTIKATLFRGSVDDRTKRNELKYRSEDTVTVDRTEEAAYEKAESTTVTNQFRRQLTTPRICD